MDAFAGVIAKFNADSATDSETVTKPDIKMVDKSDSSSSEEDEEEEKNMSWRKLRKLNKLTVAQLKQLVKKPEVVEWVDVTAADPKLLVHLKATRNSVPVPVHWSQKRKYLQAKRGIEKPPFDLPDFIKQTGITQMRETVKDKEDSSGLKSKTRERHQPKMGKITIDYQKLHDAFFRWQTKPKLSIVGDLYYEGKEYESKYKDKKPGVLSDELKMALNIPPLAPPPWLLNMQRFGPPPSYPQLQIPGLNAPIPDGAQWGYHPGGWGKPPLDEYNRPLYGEVFGGSSAAAMQLDAEIDRTLWGEMISGDEEEEDESEVSEEEDEEEESGSASIADGLVTPSGLASVPSGLETPDFIELRKDGRK